MKIMIILILTVGLFGSCNNKGGGWPAADENKFMNACMGQMGNQPNAKEICSCIMQKAEKTFPTYQDEETKGTEAQGSQWARECLNAGGNTNGGVLNNRDNNNGNNGENNNGNGGITGNDKTWTNAQREEFVNSCAPTAERAQNMSSEDAHSYCDCMARKLEEKYSYAETNRLPEDVLKSDEWMQAMRDCRPHSNY